MEWLSRLLSSFYRSIFEKSYFSKRTGFHYRCYPKRRKLYYVDAFRPLERLSIPVIWLVKEGEKGHFSEEKHMKLLEAVKEIIPENARNILLGDGEFDGKKLREKLEKTGFEYVLRTSKDKLIKNE